MELKIVIILSMMVIGIQSWILNKEIKKKDQALSALLTHKLKDISRRVDVAAEINTLLIQGLILENDLRIKFNNSNEVRECAKILGVESLKLSKFTSLGSLYYSTQTQECSYRADALIDVPVSKQIPYDFIQLFINSQNNKEGSNGINS